METTVNVVIGKKAYQKPQMEEVAMQTESMIAESSGGVIGTGGGMPWGDNNEDDNAVHNVKEKSSYDWE